MRHFVLVLASSSFLWLSGCVNAPSDDIGAATYNICCGANCCCPSIGSGGAINAGDMNPDNPCEVCDPATDPSSWTPVDMCMAGDDAGAMGGTDSGTTGGTDAGTTTDDGGGCSVSPGSSSSGGLFALLGLAGAVLYRRRRG